jgi:hypothetical protein
MVVTVMITKINTIQLGIVDKLCRCGNYKLIVIVKISCSCIVFWEIWRNNCGDKNW